MSKSDLTAIGFVHFWGFSPAINCFRGCDSTKLSNLDLSDPSKPLNILLSETSDIRHALKSISDSVLEPSHHDLKPIHPQKEINVSINVHLDRCRSISTKKTLKFSQGTFSSSTWFQTQRSQWSSDKSISLTFMETLWSERGPQNGLMGR